MYGIIDRLKEEKLEWITDYRQEGFNDGFEWAKEAHYLELQEVLVWDGDQREMPVVEDLNEYFWNIIAEDENLDLQSWCDGQSHELNDLYINGWSEGAKTFWEEVKDKI